MSFLKRAIYKLFRRSAEEDALYKEKPFPPPSMIPSSNKGPLLPSSSSSQASFSEISIVQSSATSLWPPATPSKTKGRKRGFFRSYLHSCVRGKGAHRHQVAVFLCLLLVIVILVVPAPSKWNRASLVSVEDQQQRELLRGFTAPMVQDEHTKNQQSPEQWLEENSNNKFALTDQSRFQKFLSKLNPFTTRPRAALISLVRNSELEGIMQSMSQLELRWNHKYEYPWVFFNEEPFSEDFKVSSSIHPSHTSRFFLFRF